MGFEFENKQQVIDVLAPQLSTSEAIQGLPDAQALYAQRVQEHDLTREEVKRCEAVCNTDRETLCFLRDKQETLHTELKQFRSTSYTELYGLRCDCDIEGIGSILSKKRHALEFVDRAYDFLIQVKNPLDDIDLMHSLVKQARTWQKVRPLAKMSVVDNVMVGALCRTNSLKMAREMAMEQVRVVRLEHRANFLAGGLPIGERKKLEVARVLATQPKLLLLDEVMGGLNPSESEEIIQLILDIRKLGITQMVIEHDMKAIMRISDRIVVLNSGEKLAEGAPEEIVKNPEVVAAYLGSE